MLDLGCGIGRMLEALAPRMRFCVGVEISRAMAETARERTAAHARRILRPGGVLLILNYSYRGDLARDRLDVARLAAHNGFSIARNGAHEFHLWDAALFELRRIA